MSDLPKLYWCEECGEDMEIDLSGKCLNCGENIYEVEESENTTEESKDELA